VRSHPARSYQKLETQIFQLYGDTLKTHSQSLESERSHDITEKDGRDTSVVEMFIVCQCQRVLECTKHLLESITNLEVTRTIVTEPEARLTGIDMQQHRQA